MLAKAKPSKSPKRPWLPALDWLKNYQRADFPADLLAGLVVAVMLVPQAMAYATLAGLAPVTGLYAATLPLVVYAFFGSSKHLAVGPVAIVSLLTFTGVASVAEPGSAEFVAYAALLALMVGSLQFLLGLLRLGFVSNFVSHAVISGFTSAAAIIIGLSQLKHFLGIRLESADHVLMLLWGLVQHIRETHIPTLLISLASLLLLLLFKRFSSRFPAALVVLILSSLAVYFFRLNEQGVAIVGTVPSGFPQFSLPGFGFEAMRLLLPTALSISFVSFMESFAIAKAIANKEKYKVEADKELQGLGLANMASSLFSGYPVTGGFSRTAVNYQAGAKTPLASIITALLVALTLVFFTPLFYYLPNAVLAAIIMLAVYSLIDFKEPRQLFKLKAIDGWTLLITFTATLIVSIELGIVVGIIFSLGVFVWRSAYPHIAELGYLADEQVFRNIRRYPEAQLFSQVLIARIDAPLYFANMAFLETRLTNALAERKDLKYIILDFSGVNDIDAIAVESLGKHIDELARHGIETHIASIKGPVRDLLAKSQWFDKHSEKIKHLSLEHALKACSLGDL